MSFSQLVSELGPPPEKAKKKIIKKKKVFRFWAPPPANSWTRACKYYAVKDVYGIMIFDIKRYKYKFKNKVQIFI